LLGFLFEKTLVHTTGTGIPPPPQAHGDPLARLAATRP
jgi:hypothetical protein